MPWSRWILIVVGLGMLCLGGCQDREPLLLPASPRFEPAETNEIDRVSAMLLKELGQRGWSIYAEALQRSRKYLATRRQDDPALIGDGLEVSWGDLLKTVDRLLERGPDLAEGKGDVLSSEFVWHALRPPLLVTGYYEPEIEASKIPDSDYAYPLFGLPDDLHVARLGDFHPRWDKDTLVYRVENGRIRPYFDRREIDIQGALAGRDLELAWARDPIDVFFLHIQGSGRLKFSDSTTRHILYAGRNGRQYVALGRVLAAGGHIGPDEEISMQKIRKVLHENPSEAHELMAANPSYVFFRLDDDGPYGAMGQILTSFVSVATDPTLLPLGSVMALDVPLPVQGTEEGAAGHLTTLVAAQDTGGAIKGAHIDMFFGAGHVASILAGHMNKKGSLYLLLAKKH